MQRGTAVADLGVGLLVLGRETVMFMPLAQTGYGGFLAVRAIPAANHHPVHSRSNFSPSARGWHDELAWRWKPSVRDITAGGTLPPREPALADGLVLHVFAVGSLP